VVGAHMYHAHAQRKIAGESDNTMLSCTMDTAGRKKSQGQGTQPDIRSSSKYNTSGNTESTKL